MITPVLALLAFAAGLAVNYLALTRALGAMKDQTAQSQDAIMVLVTAVLRHQGLPVQPLGEEEPEETPRERRARRVREIRERIDHAKVTAGIDMEYPDE